MNYTTPPRCKTEVAALYQNRNARLLIGIAVLLSACATPPTAKLPEPGKPAGSGQQVTATAPLSADQEALRQLVTLQDRLDRVAAPLLVNNAALCRQNARHLLGFTAKNRYSYSPEFAAAAQKQFNLSERLQVTGVLAGSGAARVGMMPGDALIAVEDKPMPEGVNAERQAAALLAPLVGKRSHVKLAIARNGVNKSVDIPLTTACAFRVELGNTDAINTYGDGHRVLVTRGMMRFAQTDQELGLVVAREMAHDILGHATQRHDTATIASVIDNLIRIHPDLGMVNGLSGIKPYAQDLDASADFLGIYLAARAGYMTGDASAFWRRVADNTPTTIANGFTALHPATNYRVAAIDRAVSAVRTKQAGNKPLLP